MNKLFFFRFFKTFPLFFFSTLLRTVDFSGLCNRDVCKEELFFPLTEAYQGEPRDKAIALSLFLIFLALVTFAVTKPWG